MRILFFSSYFYPYTSGITTYPLKLLTYLSKKHEITVLTFKHDNKLSDKEIVNQIKIVRLPYWFKISKGFISPQSVIYFIKYVKNCDLLILNIPNFEGILLALFSKLFRIKIISIFHCLVFPDRSLFLKIITFFLNMSIYLQLSFSQMIIGYTQDYVNSTWVGRIFKKKIKIVLPPIEIHHSKQIKTRLIASLQNKDIIIGYAGRVASEKGLEILIDAINIIRHSDPLRQNYSEACPSRIKLVIAGPYGKIVVGEMQYYQKIVKLLKTSQVTYELLGNLEGYNLVNFYKLISILVLPSINQTEAFGMVQVEAMLYGTPVVASDLPGVRVPIQLTKMGIITPPKDSMAIAEAITTIINNRSQYTNKKLVLNAKLIFDIKKTYRFYDQLLKTMSLRGMK